MFSFSNKLVLLLFTLLFATNIKAQDFQGQAYYFSKTTMDMSRWDRGGKMSEAQKKQMEARMKPWLEKTYILTFNKEESIFKEDEKLEGGPGGRAPSMWGSSFSAGLQYKNIKEKVFLQDQEFFGKQFLITEQMTPYTWKMGSETKKIGQYTCYKATTTRPSSELNFTSTNRRDREKKKEESKKEESKKETTLVVNDAKVAKATTEKEVEETQEVNQEMVEVVAWYSPMIPVSQGPTEYWGLPGLILELSAGNTTMLCSKIVMNPEEKIEIKRPTKGEVVTKKEYNEIITGKMQEMRDNRGRGSGGRSRGL
ncbi:GLPGLI family protein [Flavobacteriaceae bacterium]|jgi:GLPGLI family protein|nr:GLPGLI family protein [Flavobacteriaceae bacterium]MDB4175891.1 GLPGLI family protein [Flavobacteriaceae bacterium]MDB9828098.1 GLPGLI family protein [Flavobacteriaceae bacterium]